MKRTAKNSVKTEKRNISKKTMVLYIVLRVLVVAVMIREFVLGNYSHVFTCILTLVLFFIPVIVDRKFNIQMPSVLEAIILLFIFAAEILGEINEYYLVFPYWDIMLHTINGFIMAAIGFAMIDILNNSPRVAINMSPLFVAVTSFCFSMTIGVIWEFFERAMDAFFMFDMQKDTITDIISTVYLHPDGRNVPVVVNDITQTVISGVMNGTAQDIVIPGGYLDIGLNDTMQDLLVNCIGAGVFSVIGGFFIKLRGRGKTAGIIRKFVPVMKEKHEIPEETSDEPQKRRYKKYNKKRGKKTEKNG